ncbi:hypothetical protein Tco_0989081 [Tanacetum coccineum]|uniref:Uncharacterized protein n=1 Tax=Tanacetum coccineum TaxID=301880 RepID=A0ABQ5EU52_9ASTR
MLNGVWNWPNAWLSKAPELGSINPLALNNCQDSIRWYNSDGNIGEFSVKLAWEALRPCGKEVWILVRSYAGMSSVRPVLTEIMSWFQPLDNKRTFAAVIQEYNYSSKNNFAVEDAIKI